MNKKRIGLISAAVGTAGAVGVGAVVAARRYAVGRARLIPDPDAGEPFGELHGRTLTVEASDGVPLHVEIDGPDDAPLTVVFCHGYCLNEDCWHYQRRDLGRDGDLRLVFWDQRSHGRSGRSDLTHATVDQCGADLFAVLEATVDPGTPVVLVGHSMGGMTIMALADGHPELFEDGRIAAVALINTSSGELAELSLGLPMAFGKVFKAALPRVTRSLGKRAELVERGRRAGADVAFMVTRRIAFGDKHVSPSVVDFVEQMIRSTPIDVIAEFYPTLAAHDKLAALEVIKGLPALVVVGDEDRLTPAAHGRLIAEVLGDAELVELSEAGHVTMMEHPEVVTRALIRLIDRVRPVAEEERSA
ncbi:alpha/beta fold hydrolase [Actinoallomurus soli]|uniref:alpha/beta fold hydrolase n=1 Tax=Actinoallomurus soli TaxID=2952535 RepID=UPI002091EC92|nr:alpha/beta hydrolase [Actinoallomurus soli]MCO5969462.1 alpha/beta hydrolase [Actinoallomurus soli]